jgi:1-deoxyxylulose-5-phosphate synthase
MRDELSELKSQGIVRAVGCSCHTHATLRQAAEDPWVDVIFARVNPGGVRMDPDASVEGVNETLRLARANGKGVVGMKIYGEGGYASDAQRLESLTSVFANELADAITIGHMSEAQFDNTISNMELVLT